MPREYSQLDYCKSDYKPPPKKVPNHVIFVDKKMLTWKMLGQAPNYVTVPGKSV